MRAFVLYFEGIDQKMIIDKSYFSKLLIDIQEIFIAYLFAQLIFYFNYPIYDNTKQIFSCFLIYMKKKCITYQKKKQNLIKICHPKF